MYPASRGSVKCTEFKISAIKGPCISQDVTFANRLFTSLSFNSDSWNNSNTDKIPLKKAINHRAAQRRGGSDISHFLFHF